MICNLRCIKEKYHFLIRHDSNTYEFRIEEHHIVTELERKMTSRVGLRRRLEYGKE